MEIKRYDTDLGHYGEASDKEHPDGEFVLYEDHKAKCDELGDLAKSAADELFKLIESMKPRPIDKNTPKPHGAYSHILIKHRSRGWVEAWWCSMEMVWDSFGFSFSDGEAEAWLPLPPEVKR